MNRRLAPFALALAAVVAASAAHAQRIEFPRQSFDRSRFGQPPSVSPSAPPAAPVRPAPVSPVPAVSAPAATPQPAPAPSASASASSSPSRVPEELVASPRWDLIPHKPFDKPKDYDQLLELQRQTGAVLLVYFRNDNDSSEKGLCNWYEKSIALTRDWQKVTRPYLKLNISLPGNAAAQALAKRYGVAKTPAIYVHKPNDWRPMRLPVFEWNNREPKPLPVDTVVESLLKFSTEAYQKHVEPLR
jgi:hypothetical protein